MFEAPNDENRPHSAPAQFLAGRYHSSGLSTASSRSTSSFVSEAQSHASSTASNTTTATVMHEMVEYLENCRTKERNVRVPRYQPAANYFSVDQRSNLSMMAAMPLVRMMAKSKHRVKRRSHHRRDTAAVEDEEDDEEDAGPQEGDEEEEEGDERDVGEEKDDATIAFGITLSAEEQRRDRMRSSAARNSSTLPPYAQDGPTATAEEKEGTSSIPSSPPSSIRSSVASRVVARHAAAIESRDGRRQELLRHRAARCIQRCARRYAEAGRGGRLLALLALLKDERNYPRYPLMVSSGSVSAEQYFLECALEYEYLLQVENLSAGIVARRRNTIPRLRRLLSSEECSALHEGVQERLADGDFMALDALRTPLLALGRENYGVWLVHLRYWCRPPLANVHIGNPLDDSFVSALDLNAMSAVLSTRCVTTTSGVSKSGRVAQKGSAARKDNEDDVDHEYDDRADGMDEEEEGGPEGLRSLPLHYRSIDDAREQDLDRLRSATADQLALGVPASWYISDHVVSEREVQRALIAQADEDEKGQLSGVPTREVPRVDPLVMQQLEAQVEDTLKAVWKSCDPEDDARRREAAENAKRRVMGAEYEAPDPSLLLDDMSAPHFAIGGPSESLTASYFREQERRQLEAYQRIKQHVEASVTERRRVTMSLDLVSWGLSSWKEAARVLEGASSPEAAGVVIGRVRKGATTTTTATDNNAEQVHEEGRPPTICVVCELDAIDVVRCVCGQWVHRECSFGSDVDAPAPAVVQCCSVCRVGR